MTDHPIAETVATMHAARDPQDAWAAEQAALRDSTVESAIPIGAPFPEAELLTPTADRVLLSTELNGAAAVVVFYRGAWCPYCNLALATYRTELSGPLARRGVTLVAVSPQKPDGSLTMQEKHDLDFAVLSDPGNTLASALGILSAPSETSRAAQLEHGLDLTQLNADGTIGIPLPTTAIIDRDGRLAWIDIHPDYSTRTEPAEIIAALDRLGL